MPKFLVARDVPSDGPPEYEMEIEALLPSTAAEEWAEKYCWRMADWDPICLKGHAKAADAWSKRTAICVTIAPAMLTNKSKLKASVKSMSASRWKTTFVAIPTANQ